MCASLSHCVSPVVVWVEVGGSVVRVSVQYW